MQVQLFPSPTENTNIIRFKPIEKPSINPRKFTQFNQIYLNNRDSHQAKGMVENARQIALKIQESKANSAKSSESENAGCVPTSKIEKNAVQVYSPHKVPTYSLGACYKLLLLANLIAVSVFAFLHAHKQY